MLYRVGLNVSESSRQVRILTGGQILKYDPYHIKPEIDWGLDLARQAFTIAWLLLPIGFHIQLGLITEKEISLSFATSMIIMCFLPAVWMVGSLIYLFVVRRTRRLGSLIFLSLDFFLAYLFTMLAGLAFLALCEANIIPHMQDGYMAVMLWSVGLGGIIPAGIVVVFIMRPIEKRIYK